MKITCGLKKIVTVSLITMFFMIAISNAASADESSIPVSNGFDFPVGIPNGNGYNHVNGWDFLDYTDKNIYHPGEDWNGNGGEIQT